MSDRLELIALRGFPQVEPGDDLAQMICASLAQNDLTLTEGDALVLAQKIVSKAEGRYVRLADVQPSEAAQALALETGKDARQVELILRESNSVLRSRPGVIISEHRNGYVLANAGIDRSNIPNVPDDPQLLLLPEDPDRSAQLLREALFQRLGVAPQIIINDSVGRAWRNGTVGITIGSAGLQPLNNQVGEKDMFGYILAVTEPAVADELAAAASLVMGQAAQGRPVVLARGAGLVPAQCGSGSLIRERAQDMFR